jgi:hypothetical protein
MILKYNVFLGDILLENLINESMLYFSDEIRNKLKNIDNDISKELLNAEGTDVKPDMTFVSSGKDGYFSFSTMRNVLKHLKDVSSTSVYDNHFSEIDKNPMSVPYLTYLSNVDSTLYKTSRNDVSIGRFINKVFPNKYTSSDVEKFVNLFKSFNEDANEEFIMIEGGDISKWYNSEMYDESNGHKGSLWSSCMRYSGCSNFFDIYEENPGICRMLILVKNDKLIGRSLIWKLNKIDGEETDYYYMDRRYTINDSDNEKFINYAKSNNWLWKKYNSIGSLKMVCSKDDSNLAYSMIIKVKDESYDYYPYMDTFKIYKDGLLYNLDEDYLSDDEEDKFLGAYSLSGTEGDDYNIIDNRVYSDYYGDYIDKVDAVWSDPLGDWIYGYRSVEVTHGYSGNIGFYPSNYDDIIYSKHDDEYYHIDDTVYSSIYDSSILDEDYILLLTIDSFEKNDYIIGSVVPEGSEIIKESDKDYDYILLSDFENLVWYDSMDTNFNWSSNFGAISKDLLTKATTIDFESGKHLGYDYYVPIFLKVDVYEVKNRVKDIPFYLSEMDAEILGYEINKENHLVSDRIVYNLNIKDLVPKILEYDKKGSDELDEYISYIKLLYNNYNTAYYLI